MTIDFSKRISHYVGISYDETRSDGRFRLAIYGAIDAMGLIGPEYNGIVVLDNDLKAIVCDEIAISASGYYGPSVDQVREFMRLLEMPHNEFRDYINAHHNTRYEI